MNGPLVFGALAHLGEEAFRISGDHGFVGKASLGEHLSMVHDEVSEAHDAFRCGASPQEKWDGTGKPETVATELADVIIRCVLIAREFNIPVAEAVVQKVAYNETRPFQHGGKRY